MSEASEIDTVAELVEALDGVITAALRQLAFHGKGLEPSPRLKEAIEAANVAKARALGSAGRSPS